MDQLNHLIHLITVAFIAVIIIFIASITGIPQFSLPVKNQGKKERKSENPKIKKYDLANEYALADDPNLAIVKKHCTGCHSNRLIAQNRNTREGWEENIRWMQKTQGLWDLGSDELIILDYLASYYAPVKTGRRIQLALTDEEWYVLKVE